jgi:hypothetical protein
VPGVGPSAFKSFELVIAVGTETPCVGQRRQGKSGNACARDAGVISGKTLKESEIPRVDGQALEKA